MSKLTEKRKPTNPQLARHFGVSVRTLADWKASGCPTGSAGSVVAWRMERDAKRNKIAVTPDLRDHIELAAKLEDRRFGLTARMESVNAWPPDVAAEPGLLKAAMCFGLTLERGLLDLPAQIINDPTPDTLPTRLVRAVLDVLDALGAVGTGGLEE